MTDVHAALIRVAVVDDHQLVLDGLRSRLSQESDGIAVVAAESNWTSLVTHTEFPVDVVVLDLHLNDNIPIGAKLRALRAAGVPAVVMSRHSDGATINAALRAGAIGFVSKSESADELVTAIRSAAASTRHLSLASQRAFEDLPESVDAGLGRQEQNAVALYASGLSIRDVAERMGTTEETIKSYLKRARRKFRDIGLDLGTRELLQRHAEREGWHAD